MKYSSLTFITSNPEKAAQISWFLKSPLQHMALALAEIQSLSVAEVASTKAREAHKIVGRPVLVEDTSLIFSAFKKIPGPFIKHFLETLGNNGLCRLLDGHPRQATAQVCFALYDGSELYLFEAEVHGTIASEPRGRNGFGWDPVFIPDGFEKTWGEMSEDEQRESSMRKVALEKLSKFLHE